MEILPVLIVIFASAAITGLGMHYYDRLSKKKEPPPPTPKPGNQLNEALKKSEDIISQTEVQSSHFLAAEETQANLARQAYEQKLQENLDQLRQTLLSTYDKAGGSIDSSEKQFEQFLQNLQNKGDQYQTTSLQIIEKRLNNWFEQVENRMSEFLIQNEQKTVETIELEMKATRQLIESYKQQQLQLIDENIVAMLEKTLSSVLNKKLTLKDQVDLVYEALEKAKVEKFII